MLLLSSCKDGRNQPAVNGVDFFKVNETALSEIVAELKSHPAIRRVDKQLSRKYIDKYDDFNEDSEKAFDRIERLIADMNIENVYVARAGAKVGGEIISISFTLDSRGPANSSGGHCSIDYIPSIGLVDNLISRGREIHKLKEDWFFVVARN